MSDEDEKLVIHYLLILAGIASQKLDTTDYCRIVSLINRLTGAETLKISEEQWMCAHHD